MKIIPFPVSHKNCPSYSWCRQNGRGMSDATACLIAATIEARQKAQFRANGGRR